MGQQVANGASDLADQVVDGHRARSATGWRPARCRPATPRSTSYISGADTITESTREGGIVTRISEVGTALGHVVAGFFIVLFATYFFLADGDRIWAWVVRLSPRAARAQVDSTGRVAWLA